MVLTLCIRPLHRGPPCAASQWGPGQGRPATHLPPHSPFRHSLLHWFYARHLRGIYIRHQPMSPQWTSCSSSKAVMGGCWKLIGLQDYASAWDSAHRWSWWGGGRSGRVRQAHDRPYPLSCFMATVLNGITPSLHLVTQSHQTQRCLLKRWGLGFNFTRKSFMNNLSFAAQNTVPQPDTQIVFNMLVPKQYWGEALP